MKTRKKSFVLDVVRYLLASIVVVGHGFGLFLDYFGGFFPEKFPHTQSIAVVCFFYMSGYLIVGSQFYKNSRGQGGLRDYLVDRFARIYITLVPCLFFVALVDCFFVFGLGYRGEYSDNLGVVNFILNTFLIPVEPFGTMRPIWSLMYEWWLYLLFGGLFYIRSSKVGALFFIVLGGLLVVAQSTRPAVGALWVIWMMGGICALYKPMISWVGWRVKLFAALILCGGAVANYWRSGDAYSLTSGVLLSLSIFLLVSAEEGFEVGDKVSLIASKLADYSFTLFLTHYTILWYMSDYFELKGWGALAGGFVLSNVLALMIASVAEYKLGEAKRRFVKAVFGAG